MKAMRRIVTLLSVFLLAASAHTAAAHNMWLNPGAFFPSVGTTVDIGIGWGHKFPADRVDQEVGEDRVAAIVAVDPDGQDVPLEKAAADLYRLKVEKPGAYRVEARIKPGFFSMTPEGRQWGDKTSVTDVVRCTNFHILAQTVVFAGGEKKGANNTAGHRLALLPMGDPAALAKGGALDLQVMFQGAPLGNLPVKATYAGFHAEDSHPTNGKGHQGGHSYPVETVTDARGMVQVPVSASGYWMVLVSHRPPYPDTAVCDEYMINTTFTFQVP